MMIRIGTNCKIQISTKDSVVEADGFITNITMTNDFENINTSFGDGVVLNDIKYDINFTCKHFTTKIINYICNKYELLIYKIRDEISNNITL